jgi:chaperone protein EcpD
MHIFGLHRFAATLALLLFAATPVLADVTIGSTRVIYPGDAREISVRVNNQGSGPSLVEAWLDAGDAKAGPDEQKTPFSLTPPLFRLNAQAGQSLRLAYTQEPLPQDRESLFWLNVLEIPPKPDVGDGKSYLQLTVRSRIKLFFRPKGLGGDVAGAAGNATWSVAAKPTGEDGKAGGYVLRVSNPSPFYLTFSRVGVGDTEAKGLMVEPMGTAEADLGGDTAPAAGAKVSYTLINDYGAVVDGTSALAP